MSVPAGQSAPFLAALRAWDGETPLAQALGPEAVGAASAAAELLADGVVTREALVEALAHSVEPAATVAALAEARHNLIAAGHAPGALLGEPRARALFCRMCGQGRFVRRTLVTNPLWTLRLLDEPRSARPLEALLDEAIARCGVDEAVDPAALRRFRRYHTLRILLRELDGEPVGSTTAEFSDLAAACLELALGACIAHLRAEHGRALVPDGREHATAVLALGKLGGRELNYSSDVDLVFVYESDEGQVVRPDGRPHPVMDVHAWHVHLGRALVQMLSEATPDGFLFRVDMRLRPGGARGPLAHAADALVAFYESWGTTWQRSAWLKARPVAGSHALGHAVLAALEPFVYRRYLDFAALGEIGELKRRIDQQVRREALGPMARGRWDIKKGRGGIREIEFTVQALQLVYGGRRPELRAVNTLEAIARLTVGGLLSHADSEVLDLGYRLFRHIEHRLQIAGDRQTYAVPVGDDDAMHALACRLELPGGADALRDRIGAHTTAVHGVFARVLPGFATDDTDAPTRRLDLVEQLLHDAPDIPDDDLVLERLRAIGFDEPQRAAKHLRILAARPYLPFHPSGERGTSLRKLVLGAVLDSPDPDLALANLTLLLTRVGTYAGYLDVLLASPELARLLMTLFGTSDFLSKRIASFPELIEQLSAPGWLARAFDAQAFASALDATLQPLDPDDTERRLNALRRFKHEHILRIALRDIGGLAGVEAVRTELSDLADVIIASAYEQAEREMIARFGTPSLHDATTPARLAIVALGKLGGREISYASDLDLVFVYSGPGETRGGERDISLQGFYSRLVQKLISFLSTHLREGRLYVVDTRLRPSGNQGALVTSLDGYVRYLHEHALLWERQALLRARIVVAGDPMLRERLTTSLETFVYASPAPPPEALVAEIGQMRKRMAKLALERPEELNVKYGPGGIVDGEFSVQILQLLHGATHRALRTPSTLAALRAAAECGVLAPERAEALGESMRFLWSLEDRLRLLRDQSIHAWQARGPDLERLARRMGYGHDDPGEALLEAYARHTECVRSFYLELVGETTGD